MKKIRILAFFVGLFFSSILSAQILVEKIDRLITQTSPRIFNGEILISKNYNTLYSKSYGYADFSNRSALKIGDQYIIMSNSKLFTAVLVLKQVEKKKIDLNSSIKKYLPELTQSWADSVTVHQLLNHTHGIESLDKPLLFKPGSDYKYGNLSNQLLGEILENVTGKSYVELANQLFKKEGLKNTFCYNLETNNRLAFGHRLKEDQIEVLKESQHAKNIPAAGIVSNANDLTLWTMKLHNGKVLKKATYHLLVTPSAQSQHDVFGTEKMGYGYGIRIAEQNGINYFGHTGLGDGFASLMVYFPKEKLSLIILENVMGDSSDNWYYYENEIKDLVIGYILKN